MRAIQSIGDLFDLAKGRKAPETASAPFPGFERYIQIDDLRPEPELKYARDPNGTRVGQADICIAWDGANAGTVGYGLEGLIGSTIARLRPRRDAQIFSPFLGRFLQSKFQVLNEVTTGATIPHVSKDRLLGLSLFLPERHEQERIAMLLDQADAIRRKRREAIELADEFLRSTFLDIALRVRDNSLTGNVEPLSALLANSDNSIRTGPFGSDLLHSEFGPTGVPVIGIENAVTNRFRWTAPRCISTQKYQDLRRYRIFPGDVILTIMGTTGRVAIAPDDLPECISTKHLCVMTPDRNKVTSSYLWASLLFDPVVRRQAAQAGKGAIMEGWNMTIVKSLEIAVPSPTVLARFDSTVNLCEAVRSRYEILQKESENLFQSLASRAFSGELAAA